MNTPKTRPWELKLSPIHLVIVLGLVTGSMAAAFYLGFSSGQHLGYESALRASLSNMARLPVPADEVDAATSDEVTSEVYAKLTSAVEKENSLGGKDAKAKEMPELGAIASTETLPILPDVAPVEKNGSPLNKDATSMKGSETIGSLAKNNHDTHGAKSSSSAAAVKVTEAKISLKEDAKALEEKKELEESRTIEVAKLAESPKVEEEKTDKLEASFDEPKEPSKEISVPPVAKVDTAPKKEKDSSTPIRSVIPSGWYVQVAAPRSLSEANEVASALKKAKIPVMIESAQVRGEDYFRVIAGPQSQRAAAEKVMAQIKSKTSVKGDPFVRAVK